MRTIAFLIVISTTLAFCQQPTTSRPVLAQGATTIAEAREKIAGGKLDEAIAQLEEAKRANPKMPGLDRELGAAYYRKNDFTQAIAALLRATQESPADRQSQQLLGLSYYFIGKTEDAIAQLERAPEWNQVANVDARYVMGLAYIKLKDFDKARAAFATMFGVAPESGAAHLFAARMLLAQGYEPQSEQETRKALEVDPRLPLAHYLLGEFLLARQQVQDAIKEFEAELKADPAHAATYYRLADAYSRVQNWDEAQRLLQRSIWLDSSSTGPYILMGKVLLKKNENEMAIRSLARAISMDPKNDVPHYLLGQALRAVGDDARAQQEFKTAEQLKSAQNRSEQSRSQ